MREIKFRAWWKPYKKMIYSDDLALPNITFGGVCVRPIRTVVNGLELSIDDNISHEYDLMQFTGLHDKNGKGKEAYAGDRVLWDWNKEHRKIEGLIEWDKEQLAWVITNYYFQNNRKVLLANHPEIEIIGNIHQDKALLETK